jgi:hypothetical protein
MNRGTAMRRTLLLLVTAVVPAFDASAQSDECQYPVPDLASCPPCPSSTPLCRKPAPGHPPTVNGCGPEKFTALIEHGIIPQGFGDADFRNGGCPANQSCGCNQHDVCYGTCNSDKSACDEAFKKDLNTSCENAYPVDPRGRDACPDGLCFSNNQRSAMCHNRARKYYSLVKEVGQSAYDTAQKVACQCCCNSQGGGLIALARASSVNQAGPVCKPPMLHLMAHHHWVAATGGTTPGQQVTDSTATLDMPFDPNSSSSDLIEFIPMGTFHFHYEETEANCTVSAPDVDGTLTSVAENGGVGLYLVPDGIGHVANQYQGTIGAIFPLPVTITCPPGAPRVINYTWPETFFINVTRTDILDGGTGSGSYELDQPGLTQTFDWTVSLSGQ